MEERKEISQIGILKLRLKNHNAPSIQVTVTDMGLYWQGYKLGSGIKSCWPKMCWRIVGEW